MQVAETRTRERVSVGRVCLFVLVAGYLLLALAAPLGALGVESAAVGWRRMLAAVTSDEALGALGMSLRLCAVALVVNAVVGVFGAVALVRRPSRWSATVSALCDLPLAVSPVMVGLAFLLLVGEGGWLSPALGWLGLKVAFSFPGLVVATLFVTLPYTIREVLYVLEESDGAEQEVAATLGASSWQGFVRVTLPGIRVALGYGLLMTLARTLGEFGALLLLGGSISGRTQTATTFIHDAVEERDLDGAYGMALLLALASVVLLVGFEALRRRGEERGR